MGAVNFYLKAAEKKTGRSLIYLKYKYNGRVLVYSFGQTIDPQNWNSAKQRAKLNTATTGDGKHKLNDLLHTLQNVCLGAYNEELKTGIPATGQLKAHLDAFIEHNKEEKDRKKGPTLYALIKRFVDGEIKNKGKDKSKSSLNNYRSVLIHLQEFERQIKKQVNFDTITLDFFYQYVSFLKSYKPSKKDPGPSGEVERKSPAMKGLSQNTIAKDIRLLKVFMGEAVDLGYTSNLQFKHKKFTVTEEDTDAVFLTEQEIISIYNHDFSGHKKLERVRDLFVFGCFTGLRYSDYSNIRKENIITRDEEIYVKIVTQKTSELVIIPCNPIIQKIFEKYDGQHNSLPRAYSNQKFNDYVKDVCRQVGLIEVGRLATQPKMELWESVSSHTARRSFATNLYLEGFPTIDLMKITGHKTEKAFLKYIRVSKLDTAKRLNDHIKRNWSSKILKIAG